MKTDQLLENILAELRDLNRVMRSSSTDTCSPDDALAILGVNNERLLKHFADQGLIRRSGGGPGRKYIYSRRELYELAVRIKDGKIQVPRQKELSQKTKQQ